MDGIKKIRNFFRRRLAALRDSLRSVSEKNKLLVLSLAVGICSGLAAVLLETLVETIHHWLTSWFSGSADNYMSDNQLFVIQSNVIRSLADKGHAIFIGRCSDYILRDRKCLDVFVTATDEVRIKRIAERMNITPEQADSLMRKKDRTRETYYNYYTFGNWGVASNYDLCVDSSVLGIEGTADMIIDFCRRAGLLSKDAVLPFSDVNQEAGK